MVNRLNDQFKSITATTDEMAIEKFQQSHVDAVLFEKEVPAAEKRKLEKIFGLQSEAVVFIDNIVQADDLTTIILETIEKKRKENRPSFAFRDDALKNAGLNIQIQ